MRQEIANGRLGVFRLRVLVGLLRFNKLLTILGSTRKGMWKSIEQAGFLRNVNSADVHLEVVRRSSTDQHSTRDTA